MLSFHSVRRSFHSVQIGFPAGRTGRSKAPRNQDDLPGNPYDSPGNRMKTVLRRLGQVWVIRVSSRSNLGRKPRDCEKRQPFIQKDDISSGSQNQLKLEYVLTSIGSQSQLTFISHGSQSHLTLVPGQARQPAIGGVCPARRPTRPSEAAHR